MIIRFSSPISCSFTVGMQSENTFFSIPHSTVLSYFSLSSSCLPWICHVFPRHSCPKIAPKKQLALSFLLFTEGWSCACKKQGNRELVGQNSQIFHSNKENRQLKLTSSPPLALSAAVVDTSVGPDTLLAVAAVVCFCLQQCERTTRTVVRTAMHTPCR